MWQLPSRQPPMTRVAPYSVPGVRVDTVHPPHSILTQPSGSDEHAILQRTELVPWKGCPLQKGPQSPQLCSGVLTLCRCTRGMAWAPTEALGQPSQTGVGEKTENCRRNGQGQGR